MSRLFLLTALLAASSVEASSLLYNQPAAGDGVCGGSCWTSTLDSTSSGFQTFDNFQLGTSATVNSATWQGFYWNFAGGTNPVSSPPTSSWTISIWSNNGGVPGTQLFSQNVAESAANPNFITDGSFQNATVPAYQFTANLSGFVATAGTTYWFSVVSNQSSLNPLFSWTQGSGGDGSSWQWAITDHALTNSGSVAGDRAFSLTGTPYTPVPLPGTLLQLGLGLATLGLVSRRRSRAER